MDLDLSKIGHEIVSSRPDAKDLFGKSLRTWRVIYLTPPWGFSHRGAKGEGRNLKKKHPTVGVQELAQLPISAMLDEDAIILMWVPDAHMPQALRLLNIWNLKYNGFTFVWTKIRQEADVESLHFERDVPMSTGYITRGNPTPLVMGTRGRVGLRKHMIDGQLRARHDIRKQQFAPRCPNRRPNPIFRELIEQLYEGPYLELFGPGAEGWDHWLPEWMNIEPDGDEQDQEEE